MWVMVALSIVGFFVATYLTLTHYQGVAPTCAIGGCNTVITSEYAVQFGVPISLFGAAYFLALIGLLVGFLQHHKKMLELLAGMMITAGAILAVVLILIQVKVLDAICQYCIISDSISIILLFLFFYKRDISRKLP